MKRKYRQEKIERAKDVCRVSAKMLRSLASRNLMFVLNLVGLFVYHQPCACLGDEYFIVDLSKHRGHDAKCLLTFTSTSAEGIRG